MRTVVPVVATAVAVAILAAAVAPASAAPSPAPSRPHAPVSTPSGSTGSGTHLVPPPAPRPTAHGRSPLAPDPHPPAGGIGPDGERIGGPRLATRSTVLPSGAPALPRDLTARAWVVADLDTGAVLGARDPHGRYQPASIQKLLTAVTLLPRLPGAQQVTVSHRAADTEGSHAGLSGGGHYTIDQLFRGLLLVSGNDCAEALAEAAGGRAHTVALMNATAHGLAAYDTFVQTPSGLDGWSQLTSAYDMMLFLRAALAQPRFLDYDRVAKAYLPAQPANDTARVPMWNQNEQFLTTVHGALAAKTGFTDAAQHTFAGAITRHGHHYGVILLRAQRYPHDQWVQATRLVDWATRLPAAAQVGDLVTQTAAGLAGPGGTPSPSSARAVAQSPAAHAAAASTAPSPSDPSGGSSGPSPGPTGNSSNTGVRFLFIVVLVGALYLLSSRMRRRVGGGRVRGPRGPRGPRGVDEADERADGPDDPDSRPPQRG